MARGLLRAGVLCAAVALAVASCRDPTEVTLVLTTDVPCGELMHNGTSITVGSARDVETKGKDPVTVTNLCNPSSSGGDSSIGTLVLVPNSAGASDSFAVQVVSGVTRPVGDCASSGYSGCILARRELSFIPHTPLTLPIAMRLQCIDEECVPGESCVLGACVKAAIDPSKCTGSGCSEQALVDGGAPDAGPSADGPGADGPALDATTGDAPADAPASGSSADGSGEAADALAGDVVLPSDGAVPGDAGLLGSCVSAGTLHVACAGGTCPSNEVCCVASPPGGPVTETCTSPGMCNINSVGGVTYSSLACRNRGDCQPGTVCCYHVSPDGGIGAGNFAACEASCQPSPLERTACRSTCECAINACMATTCLGVDIATCSGTCP